MTATPDSGRYAAQSDAFLSVSGPSGPIPFISKAAPIAAFFTAQNTTSHPAVLRGWFA